MPVTQQKSLSTLLSQLDLRTISQAISRDFAPRFFHARAEKARQTQFSAQELREIGRQISRNFSHTLEVVPPQLVLLPVSPGHLHAYWQMDKPAQKASQHSPGELSEHPAPPLTLRIYADTLTEPQAVIAKPQQPLNFDISVPAEQSHIEVFLPPVFRDQPQAGVYRAALGLIQEAEVFQPLLHSNSAEAAALPRHQDQATASPALLQSIMSISHPGSTADKTNSGQGK